MDAPVQQAGVRAQFTGDASRFFSLALRGTVLQLPTFGFYRFWLITEIRRHLWSHTCLGEDAFEYTGRGRELLIGFLIALAILTPIYVGYFLLSIEAERTQAFASLPLVLILYVLAQYGSFRARRYRATRTVFRGVRLWMTGSGWSYAGRAILWDMLTLITLGLALPWRSAALERYKMHHTYFGDLQGAFVGTGSELFKRGWGLWLIGIIGFIGTFVTLPLLIAGSSFDKAVTGAVFGTGILILLVFAVLAIPLFKAIDTRWCLEGIRFGAVSLVSALRKRSVLWCYVKTWLISNVYFGVVAIIAATTMESLGLSFESLDELDVPTPEMIAGMIVLYVLSLLGLGVIMLQFLTRGLWQVVTESVTVVNLAALDSVAARGVAAGSLGEGLADALDFGGGV